MFSILAEEPYFKLEKINLSNIKILVVRGMPWKDCEPEVQKAAEKTITTLSKSGINIIEKEI